MEFFYQAQVEVIAHAGAQAVFGSAGDTYLQRLDEQGIDLPTSFSRRRQQLIAADMWSTICTGAARRNLRWLFIHAWLLEINSWLVRPVDEAEADRIVAQTMFGYMTEALDIRSKSEITPLFSRMRNHWLPPDYSRLPGQNVDDSERSSYFTRVCGNVSAQMAGALLGMPYFEILAAQFGNQSLRYPVPSLPSDPDMALESLDGQPLTD
ncbi:hypothetical protein JN531_016910 (plasmid) [Flagellatimonas centrodinii]|uniref:hypothetical protein n=1 Tax=Flagellatimonas centrodinii TaxID=2806210 RepID=UPI001FFC289B|nr:hypothetical protein [Flagellatimonas centrodinii]ULQ48313.1 hypothetical protein JN531_016910 [Flagellatimonas centrodinii]